MTHYSVEAWADFARREMEPENEVRMQEHLESGCRACVQTLQVWLGVLEVATGLNVHNPPDRGIRFVKALHRVFPPDAGTDRVEVPRLLLPALDPAALGIRSSQPTRRHFVFQRGNVLLEIDIDLHLETGAISLAGQLMDPVSPSSLFAERRVILLGEQSEIARTHTNQFGEFHINFAGASDLMLVIELEDDGLLVTPLPSFILTHSANGSKFREN
jgi:hypothetical protein